MNVLVTGGAGYIGRSLIEKLEENKAVTTVTVIDNMVSSTNSFFIGTSKFTKLKFIKGDILNFDLLDEVIKDMEVIYHLAAYTKHAYTYEQNIQYEQVNQWGTLNLVRAIEKSAQNLKKIIYLSSLAVYGLRNDIDLEKDTPHPANAYGISKYEGEKYIALLSNKCQVKIIRSGNVFGFNTGFREDLVLNNFIFNGLVKRKVKIYGDGEQIRPFTSLNKLSEELLGSLGDSKKVSGLDRKNLIDFQASLNELKMWLLTQLPDLEYTYLNSNLNYDGQSVKGSESLEGYIDLLDRVFNEFRDNLKIVEF